MRHTSISLGLIAALSLPAALSAQQGAEEWSFSAEQDAATGLSRATAYLWHPQYNEAAIALSCQYEGGDRAMVEATFTTSINATQSGDPAVLRWQTGLGSAIEQGEGVIGGHSEGIFVRVELFSIMMDQLASADQISYGDPAFGQEAQVTVPLRAAQGEVEGFIDYCAAIHNSGGSVALPTAGEAAVGPAPGGQGEISPPSAAAPAPDTALVPNVGPNITGHVWSRFTHVSEDVFQTVLEIGYAVPETDDVLISGQCGIGAQGPLVALQVAADVGDLADGDVVDFRITAGDGRSVDTVGTVVGVFAEFGVSGVEMVMEMSDPAWLVIAGDPTVRFERLGGQGSLTITGNGPSTIGPFLADCDQIDLLTPESGDRPSAPIGAQDGFLSCDSFGRVASRDTGAPTVVMFVNETDLFRGLLWIDPNGTPVDQAGLNPGEATSFTTDPGHVWMATDGPGNCREMIQPVAGQTEYRLLVQ